MKKAIIFFFKYPELGKVKTRLAKSIGDKKALNLYRSMLNDIYNNLKGVDAEIIFYLSPKNRVKDIKKIFKTDHIINIQNDGDLGKRICLAFENCFNNDYDRVVIIGSDTITITKSIYDKVFNLLNDNDYVIGPANDGGYYLLGINKNRYIRDLFIDINWSTDKVMTETLNILNKHQKSYKLIEQMVDIDNYDDLIKIYEQKDILKINHYQTIENIKNIIESKE